MLLSTTMGKRREIDGDVHGLRGPDEVLVIAGRPPSRDLVRAVARLGWLVKWFPSVDASARGFALVVLDLERDVECERQMCRTVRRSVGRGRILAITRERSSMGRAMLLESESDLVLSEPFATRELFASIDALVRRPAEACDRPEAGVPEPSDAEPESLRCEPLVRGTPLRDLARTLRLTETERLLLEILCTAKTPVATALLHEAVFSDVHFAAGSSHVRVHMHRLRTKLVRVSLTVQGLYGRGYRLIDLQRDDALGAEP